MKPIRRITAALILTLLISAGAAAATDVVVTMPFENVSGRAEYNWVGESFAVNLSDLLDKPGFVAVRPDERNVAYKQEGLPPTALLTRATMIKIAERAGANLVVLGTYRISGDGRDSTITVTARVIDIREGRLVGREFNRGGPLVELQRLQGELAYEILYQRNPALPFSRDQIVSQSIRPPVGAFQNLIRGGMTRDRAAQIDSLEKAIKEYSEKAEGHYGAAVFELGRVYYEGGEHSQALERLKLVTDQDPRFDEAQFYASVCEDALGNREKALELLKALAPRLPLYEVYNNIGVLLIRNKEYAEAISHLKPAADAAPRDPDTLFNLGYVYHLSKQHDNAAATLRTAIERSPGDGQAYYILSKALAANNRNGAAEASDQAKRLLSNYAEWETRGTPFLGRMKAAFSKSNYYRYKREQDLRLDREASAAGNGTQSDRLLDSAREAFFAGRDDQALVLLGQLLQTAPQSHEAHLLMGRVYERRGDFERATNALKAAIFWNPKLTAAHVLLGRIAILREDCSTARTAATRALGLDPDDQDVRALYRLLEQRCGSGS